MTPDREMLGFVPDTVGEFTGMEVAPAGGLAALPPGIA